MQPTLKVIQDYLPDSIQYLMTVISLDSTMKLVKTHGGIHIEIPQTANPNHWLADLIGMDDFKALTAVFGSTALEIPACKKLTDLARDVAILQDKREGFSSAKLALKYGMNERTIRRVLTRIKPKVQQHGLKELQGALTAIL